MTTFDQIVRRAMSAHALGRRAPDIVSAVRRAAGIYGAAPTCHGALAARMRGYVPAALERSIAARELVRVAAMRASIYLVPRELLPHALALGRLHRNTLMSQLKVGDIDYAGLCDKVRAVLRDRAMTAAEIRHALGPQAHARMQLVLGVMSRDNSLVRTRIRGGVRSQSFEYAWLADWLPLPEVLPTTHEALLAWSSLWLQANGPATAADLAWWAGIKPKEARPVLDALGAITRTVEGVALEATEAQWDALAEAPDDDAVHLIPMWDAWLMAHKDRRRYLDAAHAPRVVDRVGNVTNVMLRRGRVVGIWDIEPTTSTLLYSAFTKLSQAMVMAATEPLRGLWPITDARATTEPKPLREQPLNRFLAPLVPRAAKSTEDPDA